MFINDNKLYMRSQLDDLHNFFYIYNTENKKLVETPEDVMVIAYLQSW